MSGLEPFVGCWQEQCKEGFEEMATALKLPCEKAELYKQAKTKITYAQDGDGWVVSVGLVGVDGERQFKFQIGQPYDSADIDGSPMKSLVNINNGIVEEEHQHTNPALGALGEMKIERQIQDGQMVVKTSCAGKSFTSRYSKV